MNGADGARERLEAVLDGFERIAIAVSGGVDSMTLAFVACRRLGARARVFHAVSPAVPPEATRRVRDHAARAGWNLRIVDAGEMRDPAYLANPVDRCFFCKTDLYGTIARHTDWSLASGANLDDLGDYRPGLAAARDHGVRHPLVEAGIGKAGVRALAAALGLHDLADLPAAPCLASRIETGIRVTPARLAFVLAAERLVGERIGATDVRCRIRRGGIVVELDAAALEALARDAREALSRVVAELAAQHGVPGEVRFEPYVRGSAFLHGRVRAES
jgi:uncharacterized protein